MYLGLCKQEQNERPEQNEDSGLPNHGSLKICRFWSQTPVPVLPYTAKASSSLLLPLPLPPPFFSSPPHPPLPPSPPPSPSWLVASIYSLDTLMVPTSAWKWRAALSSGARFAPPPPLPRPTPGGSILPVPLDAKPLALVAVDTHPLGAKLRSLGLFLEHLC